MAKLCTVCGKPIVLVPSATERARKFGITPEQYTALFIMHADCLLRKREAETKELIARIKTKEESYVRPKSS